MSVATVLTSAAIAILASGCTDQTRDEYAQAGQQAGNALKTDLKQGEKAADAATIAAKKSLKEDQIKADHEGRQLADATIRPKVKSALGSATDLHASGIEVTTVNHTTTLSGSVPTSGEKKRAAEIAKGIAGSQYKIINNISVSKS